MGSFERVYHSKNGPGLVIVGRANASQELLFNDFNQELSGFYFEIGLIIVTPRYDPRERRHLLPVYDPETLDVRMNIIRSDEDQRVIIGLETLITPPVAIGQVSLQALPSQTYGRYVKNWGLSSAPSETTYERLLAYFSMNEREGESAKTYSSRLCREFYGTLRSK